MRVKHETLKVNEMKQTCSAKERYLHITCKGHVRVASRKQPQASEGKSIVDWDKSHGARDRLK
jgi:hypothetical protein